MVIKLVCDFLFCSAFQNSQGPKDTASVSLAINSCGVVNYLDHVCSRSEAKITAGAYLHWYQRYGTSKVLLFSKYGQLNQGKKMYPHKPQNLKYSFIYYMGWNKRKKSEIVLQEFDYTFLCPVATK